MNINLGTSEGWFICLRAVLVETLEGWAGLRRRGSNDAISITHGYRQERPGLPLQVDLVARSSLWSQSRRTSNARLVAPKRPMTRYRGLGELPRAIAREPSWASDSTSTRVRTHRTLFGRLFFIPYHDRLVLGYARAWMILWRGRAARCRHQFNDT